LYRYCKEKIDQTQLQWYIGQFWRAPAGPGRFLGLTSKEWRDIETGGRGRSRSLKMAPFDRKYIRLSIGPPL